ncbi:hypothetical protein [Streptomyces canus]|nr:hypothetical protein [Streptomyces canus]MCX4861003.1 hypothetical protein [Streptomyces canus]
MCAGTAPSLELLERLRHPKQAEITDLAWPAEAIERLDQPS